MEHKSDEQELQAAISEMGEALADLRRESGLSEEKLVSELIPEKHQDRRGHESV